MQENGSPEKLGHLDDYKGSSLFSAREKLALELSERMTNTGKRVTDRFFRKLQKEFTDEELVELAAIIAYENFRSKFNPVFGIEANGLCHLPVVQSATVAATEWLH